MIAARAALGRFDRPGNECHGLRSVSVMPLIRRSATVGGLADQLTPIVVVSGCTVACRSGSRGLGRSGGRTVEVPRAGAGMGVAAGSTGQSLARISRIVDAAQFIVIACVRMRAVGIRRVLTCVREVIHARVEVGSAGVLVIETERVADLLAHDVLPLVGIVVRRGIEVRVVHLDAALRYVSAALQPDLCQAEPTVIAIIAIADLHRPTDGAAMLVGSAVDRCQTEHCRLVPILNGSAEVRPPIGSREIVANLKRQRIAGACPVIAAPGVVREQDDGYG